MFTMNCLYNLILIMILFVFSFFISPSPLASGDEGDTEYNVYKHKIKELAEKKKVEDLERLVTEIERIWSKSNSKVYAMAIVDLCDNLSSIIFDDDKQDQYKYVFMQQCILNALENIEQVPIEIEQKLLQHMFFLGSVEKSNTYDKEWERQRKNKIVLALKGWTHLNEEIDVAWDPKELPAVNVSPPPSSNLPAGVALEQIADPALRAEYETAIQKNREKVEKFNMQYQLKKLKDQFTPAMQKFIIELYSKGPINLEELTTILNTHVNDNVIKSNIINAIKKRISNDR